MQVRSCATRAVAALLCVAFAGAAPAQAWQDYLKRPQFERVQVSPDGTRLAIAQRAEGRTVIAVRDAATLKLEKVFDPGERGEVHTLRWVDDQRFLVSANAADRKYNVAMAPPAMAVIARDGTPPQVLPANFLAVIEGDPEHLLVTQCKAWHMGACIDAVHKVRIGQLERLGEKIIDAPDRWSELFADRAGNVRFAMSIDDKANTRLHALSASDSTWKLVNDSEQTGLNVWPLGVDASGAFAFVEAERATGPSVVERYDFAKHTRTEVYRNPQSDAVSIITAFDGQTPIGAYYEPTHPRPVIWHPEHPDAAAVVQILNGMPGRIVSVTSASRDRNKVVIHAEGPQDPGSWYLFDRAANKASLVTRERPWLDKGVPGSRAASFKARDGVALNAVLTLPTGKERGLPMVVIPHGGPHGVYDTLAFDQEAALLASQGYAVLRVNYRGSGGYGREFEQKGWMQWGRAMQDDVTDATRWAIAEGIADPQRVCLYGASYGGYAALMGAIREPGLYRCVAGYAAPYDLAKLYKWGDIRRSDLGLDYLAKVIGKDAADLASRSPAKLTGQIKVPVFIAHGRLDPRVDVAHWRAMAKAMRNAGLEVETQEYATAGHGLQVAGDEVDFYTRLLAFLGKHTAPQ